MGSGHTNWARLLGADSPARRALWVARTAVLDQGPDHPDVVGAHTAVLADSGTAALIGRLPDWTMDARLSGHQDPRFAPNLLNLLADMGRQTPIGVPSVCKDTS
jgi:hypothetical protein